MKEANKEILKAIRKARDRMHTGLILEYTVKTSVIAFGIYLLLVLLSFFIPIYGAYLKGAAIAGSVITAGFVVSLFMTPKDKAAAKMLDSKGLEERVLTALEFLNDDSTIAMLQRQDALEHLKALNIKKEIKIKFPARFAVMSGLLAISIIISGFIPNLMEEKAREVYNVKKEISKQLKEVEEVIKRVENNNKLTLEQKEEAKAALEELKKELGKAKDMKESSKALERTENKIEMLKQKYTDKELDKIIEEFSKNEITRDLAETLKRGDINKLKSELQRTVEGLKNLNEEELKELSQNLSQLAKTLEQNPELAEAFYNLAQKMASGELGDFQDEINSLNEEISHLMENQDFSRAMEEVMQSLRNAAAQSQGQQGQNQQGQGQNQGKGSGQGQNQGQGQNGGQTGGGAGEGTGQSGKNQGSQGTNTGIGNKQPSGKDVREYEKIFTPSLPGGEGDKSPLQGNKTDEGETKEYTVDKGIGIRGEMKPYNQVIGEYKEKAFQNIEGRQIPKSLEDLVKDYFTSLEN